MSQVLYCPYCQGIDTTRMVTTPRGKQRYRCHEDLVGRGCTLLLEYAYAGQSPDVKRQTVDRAMHACQRHTRYGACVARQSQHRH
jgi:transposase-like protein